MEFEKCKVQKFKLIDFTKLDEAYKRINKRMREIVFGDAENIDPKKKVKMIPIKTDDGKVKKVSVYSIEIGNLMAEAVNGDDMITIIKCGTTGCNVDDLDYEEGLKQFKKIVNSEENKNFFTKAVDAKMSMTLPNVSSSDSGTLSSPSSEKE